MESTISQPISDKKPPQTKSKKKKSSRCKHSECKKKLSFTDYACKCGKKFCQAHRSAPSHNCTFDWKKSHQMYISKVMISGKSNDSKNFVSM